MATSTTATPTALAIISAIYASVDKMNVAQAKLQQGPNIIINMSDTSSWVDVDPWVGVTKCLTILHSYGASSIRTFVACEGDGYYKLTPGPPSPYPETREITRQGPHDSNFSIVSVVWGSADITSQDVYTALVDYRKGGQAVPFTNEFFGKDTLYGGAKSGAIFYTLDNYSSFSNVGGREGTSNPLPSQ